MINLDNLIEDFVEVSTQFGEAAKAGDIVNLNKQMLRIHEIRRHLKSMNSTIEIVRLINHPNEFVRLKTAYTLLLLAPERSKEMLKELSAKEEFWSNGLKII
ncbi:DUF2019 domain-containing protein [Chengkuizengella sediminis]|uniref:DUF2019 domain-containing protein n=1 Tax=Chengkuizengella sediminis TaxID=1885917 RepID=UPI001389A81B|nr:DUF2019 domain-containing protein [Chengkuizengella sediminis]NDI35193.1 DUF2019 domain-containing protein [Chengkuizengella sediminis]